MTTYCDKELEVPLKAVKEKAEVATLVITSSSGKTKHLSINLDSIESIRAYLDITEEVLTTEN